MPRDPFSALERRAAQQSATIANAPQQRTWSFGSVVTGGYGETRWADRIGFDVAFLNEPQVAYGHSVQDPSSLIDGQFPRCHGGVADWDITPSGLYVGAWVYTVVDAPSAPVVVSDSVPLSSANFAFKTITFPVGAFASTPAAAVTNLSPAGNAANFYCVVTAISASGCTVEVAARDVSQSFTTTVYFQVVAYPQEPDPLYQIDHRFTFSGTAMKIIAADLL